MKKIASLIIGIFIIYACLDQPLNESTETNTPKCIQRDLKLLISNSYHDTSLAFRNSISHDTSIMIICDTNQINFKTERILLESKYLPDHKTKGYFSFLTCTKAYDDIKEIGFFHVQIKTRKAWEFRKFRIKGQEINGIICLPGVINEFMSTQKYDSLERVPLVL